MNTRRLYRSRNDKQLAGVAGGMAAYLDIDPTLVRILWILSVFLGGFTILLYVILAFIMPLAPAGPAGPSWVPGGTWGPGAAWGPSGAWAPAGTPGPGGSPSAGPGGSPSAGPGATTGPAAGPAAAPADGEDGAAETADASAAGPSTADASPTESWNPSQAGWASPAWTGGQAWASPAPEQLAPARRGPGAAVYAGVLLVVFGTIALADAVIPGLSGFTLAPALFVALGAALLIGSMRRSTGEA